MTRNVENTKTNMGNTNDVKKYRLGETKKKTKKTSLLFRQIQKFIIDIMLFLGKGKQKKLQHKKNNKRKGKKMHRSWSLTQHHHHDM